MDTEKDLRDALKALERSKKTADTLNRISSIFLSTATETYENTITAGMSLIADMADLDRLNVWRNTSTPNGLLSSQIYRWDRKSGGALPPLPELINVPYSKIAPRWGAMLSRGKTINSPVKLIPEAELLSSYGIVSVFIMPIHLNEKFWGFVLYSDHRNERYFDDDSAELMRSAAFLCANAIIRAEMERELTQAHNLNQNIIKNAPFGLTLFDENIHIINCNDKMLNICNTAKRYYIDHFFDFSPKYQPDGKKSVYKAHDLMKHAITAGKPITTEWLFQTIDGEPVPCELTITCVENDNKFTWLGFAYDLRDIKKMSQDLNEQSELLQTLNHVSSILLEPDINNFEDILLNSLGIMGTAMDIDRLTIWKNYSKDGRLFCTLINEWAAGSAPGAKGDYLTDMPYNEEILPGWYDRLSRGECVSVLLSEMSQSMQLQFSPQGIQSVFATPVFVHDNFWGFVGCDGCLKEKLFTKNETNILRSASRIIANAVIRNEMTNSIINTTVRLESAVKEANEANRLKNVAINSLESILNGINALIYITVPATGELLFVNSYMKKVLNRENDDFVGEYCYKFLRGFDKICDYCPCFWLENNPDKTIIWDDYVELLNCQIRHSDCLIDWPNGDKVHLQHAVDITELINARVQAEESNRMKTIFLSHMSHEIRTPMNAILGIAEIQLQTDTISDYTREAFGKIYESGDLLLNIINDILDLSKIESGKMEITAATYDIASLINDTAQLNRLRYENKPILFDLHVDENTPLVLIGDELRIKQVLNNVLSNAFKYTKEGKVGFSVFVEPCENDPAENVTLVFRVSDTGQGMKEEQLTRLFEEYTRFNMETNRNILGAGLGMNITKRLVDLMSGTISAESRPGIGSVFTVRLPQKLTGSDVCGAEMAEKLRTFNFKSASILKKTQFLREYMPYGSVLVVDDVESNLYVAKGMLVPYGLKIEVASGAREAIEKVSNGNVYDIIFMDHMMPEMDGIVATKKLRDMGYTHPIIALTANTLIGQAQMFMKNGFDSFLSKPIDSRELNLLLNDFIRNRKPPEVVEAAQREQGNRNKTISPGWEQQASAAETPEIEKYFILDAENILEMLTKLNEKIEKLDEKEINSFVIAVHGIKSALINIGETELSNTALRLEKAGKERDFAVLSGETPFLINALQSLIEKLRARETERASVYAVLDKRNSASEKSGNTEISVKDLVSEEDRLYLGSKLLHFKSICAAFDIIAAKAILEELKQKNWPPEINNLLDEISIYLLHSEFEEAADTAENFSLRLAP